jgi:chorismate dehydratase
MGNGTPDRWRRLRPDSHSVTSNVLARIILEKKLRLKLEIGEPIPPDGWEPPEGGAVGEAFVLIGSRALRWRDWASATGREATALDLGREWWDWTGLPAVFAVWVARPGVELGDWPRLLEEHKRRNRDRLDAIAAAWPGLEHNRMTAADARDYMTNVIEYDLDGAALEGLARFRREAGAFL